MGNRFAAAMLALVTAAAPAVAFAETVKLTADLSGKSEVPPHDGAATGKAEMTLDTDTLMLTWTVTYQGLSGPAIGAHIHGPVAAGANAGILVPFPTVDSPISGSKKLSQDQAHDILEGLAYVNIHTKEHPGGEIRGQLQK